MDTKAVWQGGLFSIHHFAKLYEQTILNAVIVSLWNYNLLCQPCLLTLQAVSCAQGLPPLSLVQ